MDCDLDVDAVAAWASGRVAGLDAPLKATRLAGGQSNPTYQLESANGAWILRRLRWPALRQPICDGGRRRKVAPPSHDTSPEPLQIARHARHPPLA